MFTPGTRLGPYDIEATLGSGGAGQVYRARDTRLGRAVAIKILSPGADAPALRDRLQREARAISQLAHPHICTLYDIGVTPEGVNYLVMELVEGETLERTLARGTLPLAQALTWGTQIADAVGAAHRAGIIHGDLKPGNVMVTRTGVKLLDFGLATERAPVIDPAATDEMTRTDVIATTPTVTGTLQYLAPEQIEGRPADECTDLFACGAVLYEMITGRKAFDGPTPASVIAAILREDPPAVTTRRPEAPPSLDRIVRACLAKDPNDRWRSAADLARELRWMQSAPAEAAASAPVVTRGVLIAIAAAAALLLAIATALLAHAYLRPEAPPAALARTSVLLPEGIQFPAGNTLGGAGRFSLSPDGKKLAFVAVDAAGNQMLWLRPIDSLTASPIAGTAGASSPFWSPDSDAIAFFAQQQLKVVTLPGGATRVVAERAFNATGSWSGDTILFTPSAASPIARVSASGGTPKDVTALDKKAGDVIHRSPYFLPDGRHFLYVAVAARPGGTAPRAVYVGSIDDAAGAPKLLMDSGSTAKYADGYVIFPRENRLMAQPFDAASLTLSGEPRVLADQVELSGVASATFSVSKTGALVYQSESDGSQLVWVDRQGRQMQSVGEPGRYGDLELSPDGREAAVSMLDAATNTRDLWVIDLARGVRNPLTVDRAEDVAPVWSRDGAQIAFASNRNGHFDVFETSASGFGEERAVFRGGDHYPVAWGPDGTLLLWAFAGGPGGVFTLPAAAQKPDQESPHELLRWIPDAGATQVTLSADGRWALYVSSESGRAEVYVTTYPATAWRMQVSIGGGTMPRWRADGREIYFLGRENKLMVAGLQPRGSRLDVGAPQVLFDVRPVSRGSYYAPAADGQQFLINRLRDPNAAGTLTVVHNWTSALEP